MLPLMLYVPPEANKLISLHVKEFMMTKIERIIPKIMQAQPVTSTEVSSVNAEGLKVTSRVENINEGHCPICGTQLSPTEANGNIVLYCAAHNIVMPVRD